MFDKDKYNTNYHTISSCVKNLCDKDKYNTISIIHSTCVKAVKDETLGLETKGTETLGLVPVSIQFWISKSLRLVHLLIFQEVLSPVLSQIVGNMENLLRSRPSFLSVSRLKTLGFIPVSLQFWKSKGLGLGLIHLSIFQEVSVSS
jgi:hypothetical protein